ncbi:MAG: GTP-binding protein [Candidatus Altiarchaeota archaeon]
MPTTEERITDIEEEIKNTSYNKASQHHIGKLKAKLAELREDLIKKSSGGKKGPRYAVKREGQASVALIGFPSVGKSTLLNRLTNAKSPIAAYDFTTLKVFPGMMEYRGMNIQILDIPGIISGASRGKGRGREVLSIARGSNLIMILLDVFQPQQLEVIKKELFDAGIRLNGRKPRVSIRKTSRGGVILTSTVELKKIDVETVRGILNLKGIHNAEVTLHEDIDDDQFIDVLMANRSYVSAVICVNKIDTADEDYVNYLKEVIKEPFIPISADKNVGLDELREDIFKKLDVIRVYLKPQGGKPDYEEPLIVARGSSVADICKSLHSAFQKKFRYAQIWGKSAKHKGQRKGLDHVLADKDVLSIIKEN